MEFVIRKIREMQKPDHLREAKKRLLNMEDKLVEKCISAKDMF